jgi:catechol 2,3-dioxygenase-like lactoylglutathione lyase family enzyme
MLTQIDHVGIACHDLEEKIDFYCSTFGLTVAAREVHEEQGVREAMLLVATVDPGPGAFQGGPPDLRAAAGTAVGAPSGPDLRAAEGGVGPGAAAGSGPGGAPGSGPGAAPWAGLGAYLAGGSYIQLLEPLGPDSPVGKFLARRGEGIHHIGYGVTDVRAALAVISATGIRLVDERPRHGSMGASIAFLHPADLGGVLTELVEHPADQRTDSGA